MVMVAVVHSSFFMIRVLCLEQVTDLVNRPQSANKAEFEQAQAKIDAVDKVCVRFGVCSCLSCLNESSWTSLRS